MKYLLYDFSGFFVNDPVKLVFRVFYIPVGRICAERLSGLTFCFEYRPYLTTCVFGVKLIPYDLLQNLLTYACLHP